MVLAVAGLQWVGLSLRCFHFIIYFKIMYQKSPSGQGCSHFPSFCCHQPPPCGLVNIISSKEKSRQFWEMFLVLFSFFLFYTWLQFQEELPEYNKKAVFTPQMSRGHTTMLLNTFGAVPVKSCVYEEKQEGSVFYSLSQNAKVWGCGCNSQPSGLSGSARPLGMKGFGGELVR